MISGKLLKIGLFCAFLAAGLTVYAANINILTNPDFESGTSGWTARGGVSITTISSPVNSGTASAYVDGRTATWQGIQQNVLGKMVENATYQISGWIRLENVSSDTVIVSVQKTDGNGTSYSNIDSITANDTGWAQLSGNYTLTVSGLLTELYLYFEGPAAGVSFFVDDAVVYGPEVAPPSPTAGGIVDINTRYQNIRGFGGMNFPRWIGDLTASQADTAFGNGPGQLGLSILRVSISPDSSQWYLEVPTAQRAKSHGAIVLATPWSPPASMKSNNSTIQGELRTDAYNDYANYLRDFADYMSSNGASLYAISVQNEPDWLPDYESCGWTPTQMQTFLNNNASVIPTKVLAPATIHYNSDYVDAVTSSSECDIVGVHLYGGALTYYSGKEYWMTEHYTSSNVSGNLWPDALDVATEIHDCMNANMSAYIWWYIRRSYGPIDESGNVTKRGYILSQYAKFVRPEYTRVDATDDSTDVHMSAYISPDDSQMSVIIINTSSSTDIDLTLSFTDFTIASGDVYRTSQTENCAAIGSFDPASALNLPAQSVTTLSLIADSASMPPNPPEGLAATAADAAVSLNWNANAESDLAGYNVYRSTTSGSGYTKINDTLLTSPGFTDNSVTNYTTYFYVVTAIDTDTNESIYSSEVEVMPNDGSIIQLSSADFESGFGDWVNITGEDSHDWTRDSGGTQSPATGPDSGANGSTWYVYLEASAASSEGDTAILESPMIHGFGRMLTFYYHMYGSNIGTLNVDVYDGTWHEAIWSLSGQQHTSNSDEYTQAIIDLIGYTGLIQIRFRAVAAGGFRGDMAIDDIMVTGATLYGDMNADNIVDVSDLPDFMAYWLLGDCGLDLNGDCLINLHEFAQFAKNWLDDSFQ